MKKLLKKLQNTDAFPPAPQKLTFAEVLEENLVEVAFAEAADYDEIHKALALEHFKKGLAVSPDECRYDDSERCFRRAA